MKKYKYIYPQVGSTLLGLVSWRFDYESAASIPIPFPSPLHVQQQQQQQR